MPFQFEQLDSQKQTWYTQSSSPEYCDYLYHNASPSEEHRSQILAHLQASKKAASALSDRIVNLQETLLRLQEQKAQVLAVHDMYRTILSPIRCLPEDVLHEIFLWRNQLEPYPVKAPPFKQASTHLILDNGPWYLGHVCRAWRQAIMSSSVYWRSILFLEQETTEKDIPESIIYLLEEGLRRAKSSPLQVRFHFATKGTARRILQIAIPCSHTWSSLVLRLRKRAALDPGFVEDLLAPLQGRLDVLRHLEFRFYSHKIRLNAPIMEAFDNAPALREVQWHTSYPRIPVALHHLTRLELHFALSIEQVLFALQVATSLKQLLIRWSPLIESDPMGHDGDLLCHDKLSHLNLERADLLTYLTLPSLSELEIEDIEQVDVDSMDAFLARSRCPLKVLRCTFDIDHDSSHPPRHFLDMLEHTVDLIELSCCTKDELFLLDLFERMTANHQKPPLVPHLRRLEISVPWLSPNPTHFMTPFITPLLSMLKGRWSNHGTSANQCFESLRFNSQSDHPHVEMTRTVLSDVTGTLAEFQRLKKEGLDVFIFHGKDWSLMFMTLALKDP
jgi:hypothetical protein